jgi:glycosyltransferase involved in cell wall biosynthesis
MTGIASWMADNRAWAVRSNAPPATEETVDPPGAGTQVIVERTETDPDLSGHRAVVEAPHRLITVIAGIENFGVRTFLLTQSRCAAQAGLRFHYATAQDGACAKALRAMGATVDVVGGRIPHEYPRYPVLLPFYWLANLPQAWRACAGLRRFLLRTPCDIVYAHSYYSLAVCALAARGMNCHVVGHLHGRLNQTRFLGLQYIFISIVLAACADKLVAISDFVAASLWGPARRKVCRIDNGIDLQGITAVVGQVAKDPRRIVIVGRLVAWKKQQVAIHALRHLRDRGLDCELEIIGGPADPAAPYYLSLRQLVDTLDLGDHVRFAGVLSPPYRHIAAASACVSCATREPFGLAVVEAAACGTPVVAANAGAMPELIEHDRTGLLFRPDDPVALADALQRLLGDEPLRVALAEAARRRALERYDIVDHLRALGRCFDLVIGSR